MMVRDIVFPPGNSNVLQLESRRVDFSSQFNERINRNLDINATEILTNEPSRYIFKEEALPLYCDRGHFGLNIFHLNCQGLNSAHNFLSELINTNVFQVIALTETWLNDNNSQLLHIPGYNLYVRNREYYQHGGLAAYIQADYKVSIREDLTIYREKVCECFVLHITRENLNFCIVVVYRPPQSLLQDFMDLFEEQLMKLPINSMPCFIMGDFNIDLIDQSSASTEFINRSLSNGFHSCINIPTRITGTSAKLLDNILSNVPLSLPRVLINDVSDHFGVSASFRTVTKVVKGKKSRIPVISKSAMVKLKNDIEKVDWYDVLGDVQDANSKFVLFYEKLQSLISQVVILKPFNRKHSSKKPWISPVILKQINVRDKLFRAQIINPTQENKQLYKIYRNRLNTILRNEKKKYFEKKFKEVEGCPKKTWGLIKEVIGLKINSVPDELVSVMGKTLNSEKDICNEFQSYFSNIGLNLAMSVVPDSGDPTSESLLRDPIDVSLHLRLLTVDEIKKIIYGLRSNSSGSDHITLKTLKCIFPVIAEVLCGLINECFRQGKFPDCFKVARITPIHKGGIQNDPGNYRPISVLPIISRVLEKCFSIRMMSFLEDHKLLVETQFGFRRKRTTEQAMIYLTTIINDVLDKGFKIGAIFLDLMKAFDTVDHELLLKKCEVYGLRGKSLNFLRSFLSNRYQYVQLNDSSSEKKRIEIGVPQGSVLGPILFLIFINDLPNCLNNFCYRINELTVNPTNETVSLFADDTTAISTAKTAELLQISMKESVNRITAWLRVNKLRINMAKSNFIIFSRSSNFYPWIKELDMPNGVIKRTASFKYLGIVIDETLSFKEHVTLTSKILARNLGIMKKLQHCFPKSVLRHLYFSLIHPYILYCSSIWLSTFSSTLKPIRVLQNHAVRILAGISPRMSVREIYPTLKILPAAGLREFYVLWFIFGLQQDVQPRCFGDLLSIRSTVHSHDTRGSADFCVPRGISSRSCFSVLYRGTRKWNSLNSDIKTIGDPNIFRKIIKELLFAEYEF